MARIQEMVNALHDYFADKGTIFAVNQDVNSSAFDSGQTDVGAAEDLAYRFSGDGAFDLVVDFYNQGGTSIDTQTISSSDGSEINGKLKCTTNNVQVQVNDQSGASNSVSGSAKAR